jgi:hypothetical protein
LAATRDQAIWSFATANRVVLVTKDEDRQPSDDGVSDWMHERRISASESGAARFYLTRFRKCTWSCARSHHKFGVCEPREPDDAGRRALIPKTIDRHEFSRP